MGVYACPRCGNPNGWWSGNMRDIHDCPGPPRRQWLGQSPELDWSELDNKPVDGVAGTSDASAWWALVMGAAASIEDAANCLRDPDAKKQAEGAAKHYREAAQKLWAARGVMACDAAQQQEGPK